MGAAATDFAFMRQPVRQTEVPTVDDEEKQQTKTQPAPPVDAQNMTYHPFAIQGVPSPPRLPSTVANKLDTFLTILDFT